MTRVERMCVLATALCAGLTVHAQAQARPNAGTRGAANQQLPDAPGKDTVQRLCGTCHSSNLVLGRGHTREEWGEVVASMISRGAKGTPAEFTQVVDYLSKNLPPKVAAGASTASSPRRGGGGGFTLGPNDKHVVDASQADAGKKIYAAECITCHGPRARGTDNGADLVRSNVVKKDRYGDLIGPFLKKGHQTQSGKASSSFTSAQVQELAHFLHQQLNDTLRSGPFSKPLNVLTGDPKTGQEYFNGEGKCSTCHSPTGDLAGIASKYDPPNLQQRFIFPKVIGFGRGGMAGSKVTTVTVTTPDGKSVSGTLETIDDFSVTLRDQSGQYYSFKRTDDLKVEKHDPYAAHYELLDKYTDKNIHDLTAYLETLK